MREYEVRIKTSKGYRFLPFQVEDDVYLEEIALECAEGPILVFPFTMTADGMYIRFERDPDSDDD